MCREQQRDRDDDHRDVPNSDTSASGSGCMSKRISMLLEEEIKLHRFASISPEQFFTYAGRYREAMVAAD
jgi:hypothetical protein